MTDQPTEGRRQGAHRNERSGELLAETPASRNDAAAGHLLSVSGLSKRYGSVQALAGCRLSVGAGEVHGLVGANGAGKSTLVGAISGAIKPDEGTIQIGKWEGQSLTPRLAQNLGVATIYQVPDLVPTFGLAENIALGREPKRLGILQDRGAERRAAHLAAEQVGLSRRGRSRLVKDMSRAEQTLVEIAKALHRRAQVIVMDEPTAALGPADAARLEGAIRLVTARGVSVLYVSHRLPELMRVCDRVTVMRDGASVLTADTGDLTEEQILMSMTGGTPAAPREHGAPHADRRGGKRLTRDCLRIESLGQGTQLQDISLELRAGEVVALAGLVGAGRSRLLQTIVGLQHHDRGHMSLGGVDYHPDAPGDALRRGVALVSDNRQQGGLLTTMTVRDNIMITAPVRARFGVVARRQEQKAAAEWIRRLKIAPGDPEKMVETLSGGNQQKVLLARWLHARVRVLLIDEPTQGVDVTARREIIKIIRDVAHEGTAVLVSSSEPEELFAISDRILVMRRGTIAAARRPEDTGEDEIVALASGAKGAP